MEGLKARVAQADSFVHLQDLPETDLLLASDYAAHEAGFAAAQGITGGQAALYHFDVTNPQAPRARLLPEEIARVVQARAANPHWIDGMRAHGFRGAAEIAATLDHMASFAQLAGAVGPHLFDAYHEATLGDPETAAFLRDSNPGAHDAMQDTFRALHDAGLWQSRRNSIWPSLAQRGRHERCRLRRAGRAGLVPGRLSPDDVRRRAGGAGAPVSCHADGRTGRALCELARRYGNGAWT